MSSNTSGASEIGKRIAELRKKAGLTQGELANRLSVKRETVNQWENGVRQIKGPDIADLADALGTTCDYILRGISSENLDVYQATGLSDRSINYLRFCKTWGVAEYARVINILLDDAQSKNTDGKRSYKSIIESLYSFFLYSGGGKRYLVTSAGDIVPNTSTDGTVSVGATSIDATMIENAILVEIQNALISLKGRLERG